MLVGFLLATLLAAGSVGMAADDFMIDRDNDGGSTVTVGASDSSTTAGGSGTTGGGGGGAGCHRADARFAPEKLPIRIRKTPEAGQGHGPGAGGRRAEPFPSAGRQRSARSQAEASASRAIRSTWAVSSVSTVSDGSW